MSRYLDALLDRADAFWTRGEPLPIDLYADLLAAGIDVETLEHRQRKEPA